MFYCNFKDAFLLWGPAKEVLVKILPQLKFDIHVETEVREKLLKRDIELSRLKLKKKSDIKS